MNRKSELVKQARELSHFFDGTYASEAIASAIETGNEEVIRSVVEEYSNQRELIEQFERNQLEFGDRGHERSVDDRLSLGAGEL